MHKFLFLLGVVSLFVLALSPVAAQEVEKAHVRVAHLSPDTPPVDIFVNGTPSAIRGLEFGKVTDWVELDAGQYTLSAVPKGGIRSGIFDLPAGGWITVAAIGSLSNNTLTLRAITEDVSPIREGRVRVTVFHAIEDAPPVDVWSGEYIMAPRVAYPGTILNNDGVYTFSHPAGSHELKVVPNGATEPVILDLPDTLLVAGVSYFMAVTGTLDAPQVVIAVTDLRLQ